MRRIVFVASAHRSGSTLLTMVLGSHPRALDVGEFGSFPDWLARPEGSRCNCGAEPFTACPFWEDVTARVRDGLAWDPMTAPYAHRIDFRGRGSRDRLRMRLVRESYLASRNQPMLEPAFRLVGGPAAVRDVVGTTLAFYDAAMDVSGAEMIVDCQKEPARVRALAAARPESRVLYLTRDGRGVVASHLTETADQRAWAESPQVAARRWVRQNREFQQMLGTLEPHQWRQVRYEDLCARPEATVASICEFLEIPFEPLMLDFSGHAHHTVGGNRMRFRGDRAISLDERWRRRLGPEELGVYDRIAGRMHRKLGYAA